MNEIPFNEVIRCGVCGSDRLKLRWRANDRNWQKTTQRFMLMECGSCGVVQTAPRPYRDQLHNLYPDVYYPIGQRSDRYFRKYIEAPQIDKVEKIRRFKTSGRLLDVGCGAGYFMRAARESGFDVLGLEFSEAAKTAGGERWGLDIIAGEFLDHSFPENQFDVVTLWQVLEHLYDPSEVFKKIIKILRPEGLVVIAVPNIASIQARLFRARWYHLDVPRHLFHYSPRTLRRLMESHGFKILAIDQWSREHNGAGILGSVMRLSPPGESLVRMAFRKIIAARVTYLLSLIESSIGRGGTFTIFASKK